MEQNNADSFVYHPVDNKIPIPKTPKNKKQPRVVSPALVQTPSNQPILNRPDSSARQGPASAPAQCTNAPDPTAASSIAYAKAISPA